MRSILITSGLAAVLLTAASPLALSSAAAAAASPAASDAALRLPSPKAGRTKPLVVVVAENAGAEATDFTIPYGVIKASGVAEVRSLSTASGPVQLMPAIRIMADQTLAQFDVDEPAGADVVIIPAQMQPKDLALLAWVRTQAAKGATIVSVCEGARVLANAGLLENRRATSHWNALGSLEKAFPNTTWVRDRRYVQDGSVISTTGVSASLPASIALVEAVGGREVAKATADRMGVPDWSPTHHTGDFHIRKLDYVRAIAAMGAFWAHEVIEAPVSDGVGEVSLALRADALTRSYRTKVVTATVGRAPVRSQYGLTILPDQEPRKGRLQMPVRQGKPVEQLNATLSDMERRYGPAAARLAWLGMEYPRPRLQQTAQR